jgi:hypothetical protein
LISLSKGGSPTDATPLNSNPSFGVMQAMRNQFDTRQGNVCSKHLLHALHFSTV